MTLSEDDTEWLFTMKIAKKKQKPNKETIKNY